MPPTAITPLAQPTFSPGAQPPGGDGGITAGLVLNGVQGFCIAFDSATLEENPVWTRLDDPTGPYLSQSFDIQRGRSYELDRTGTGTATETRRDNAGVFDQTNTTSPFSGKLLPLKQAAYALFNPVAGTWHTIWRGFVSEWANEPYPTEQTAVVTVSMADAFGLLAAVEMVPTVGGAPTFGAALPATATGNVYFEEDLNTNAVQTRIDLLLNQFGWPQGLRNLFTGNVKLLETSYAPRTQALSVLHDAADAEWPTVANTFVMKDGRIAFRGRLARFVPANYGINSWSVGDQAAVNANPATVVPVTPPVTYYTDDEHVYTVAIATPQYIEDADIAGQVWDNFDAIAIYGRRTWSAENLATAGGQGTTALEETWKFAEYVHDNYSTPRTRVGQLTFKALASTGQSAAATWAFVSGVEIGDLLTLKTTHVGGGGFNNVEFFVEGLHYQILPLNPVHHQVTLTVDVSPRSYYSSSPF